jgi:hypothetical protein
VSLRLREDLLPEDPQARHGRLRDYFCDKDAAAVLDHGMWHLELAWPGGVERHVDRRIEEALAAWGGIGLGEMAMARRRSGRVLTALYDTWTLQSWSEWASRARPSSDSCMTILHLDDHRDLGSPRLAITASGVRDMITGRSFDVGDPASVLSACESGAVGMGSFLTPFLRAFPNCDVRQLGQAPKVTGTADQVFAAVAVADDLISPGAERPSVVLDAAPDAGTGPGRYRTTDDTGAWLEDVGPGPVLLHMDMDYFNNRYDGDCDWPDRHPRHDPPLRAVLERIDEVTEAIRASGLLDRIEDAVVAFSPGFFPAEFWEVAERRLRQGLSVLYD